MIWLRSQSSHKTCCYKSWKRNSRYNYTAVIQQYMFRIKSSCGCSMCVNVCVCVYMCVSSMEFLLSRTLITLHSRISRQCSKGRAVITAYIYPTWWEDIPVQCVPQTASQGDALDSSMPVFSVFPATVVPYSGSKHWKKTACSRMTASPTSQSYNNNNKNNNDNNNTNNNNSMIVIKKQIWPELGLSRLNSMTTYIHCCHHFNELCLQFYNSSFFFFDFIKIVNTKICNACLNRTWVYYCVFFSRNQSKISCGFSCWGQLSLQVWGTLLWLSVYLVAVPAITSHLQQPSEVQTGKNWLHPLFVLWINRQFCRTFWQPLMNREVLLRVCGGISPSHTRAAFLLSVTADKPPQRRGCQSSESFQRLCPLQTGPQERRAERWRKQSNGDARSLPSNDASLASGGGGATRRRTQQGSGSRPSGRGE